MTSDELRSVVALMRELGVVTYKDAEIEISLEPKQHSVAQPKKGLKPASLAKPPAEPDLTIPDSVHEAMTVYKMSDNELMDKLFPLPDDKETV